MEDKKFRVWFGGGWSSGSMYDSDDFALTADGQILCKDSDVYGTGNDGWLPLRNSRSSGCEVMLFTGLKDKNGVEIYEGDIVTGDTWGDSVGQVRFNQGSFETDNYLVEGLPSDLVVIGNIYQNRNLIKE